MPGGTFGAERVKRKENGHSGPERKVKLKVEIFPKWNDYVSNLSKVFSKFVCFNLLFLVFSFVFREVGNDCS